MSGLKVSVIACGFNHERFAERCLDSIGRQLTGDCELIITDDDSTDDTVSVVRGWLDRHPEVQAEYLVNRRNEGLPRTLNRALSYATGDLVVEISLDDGWLAHRLESHVRAFDTLGTNVGVVYSDARVIDDKGHEVHPRYLRDVLGIEQPPSGRVGIRLAESNFVPAMAATIRRSAIDSVGGYDETLLYEDWDMWFRLAATHDFAFLPGVVAEYRRGHAESMTAQHFVGSMGHLESTLRLHLKAAATAPELREALVPSVTRYLTEMWTARHPMTRRYAADAAGLLGTRRLRSMAALIALGLPSRSIDHLTKLLRPVRAPARHRR